MKIQTLIDIVNRNNSHRKWREPLTVDGLKSEGITHLAVEADGSVFTWRWTDRPLAHLTDDGFHSLGAIKKIGIRNCDLGSYIGDVGYSPVNWHRMVYAVK